jgi:hypothetical protein
VNSGRNKIFCFAAATNLQDFLRAAPSAVLVFVHYSFKQRALWLAF